jgi:GR25 family glycosyltransferase involved in LPS biosynthesis
MSSNLIGTPAYRMPVYVINLKRSPERWSFMENQCRDRDIAEHVFFLRVDAFDAKTIVAKHESQSGLDIIQMNDITIRIEQGYRTVTASEYACLFSHLKAIRQGLLDDHAFCIVSEDDASFSIVRHWSTTLPDLANLIGSHEPCIMNLFGNNSYDGPGHIVRGDHGHGAVAYMINRAAMQKVSTTCFTSDSIFIPFIKNIHIVADSFLYNFIDTTYTSKYAFVYPYNICLTSTIHDDHTSQHLTKSIEIINRTVHRKKDLVK